jgi:hypothetical protein
MGILIATAARSLIGGSFQSLTSIFGDSFLNVGQEARDFTRKRQRKHTVDGLKPQSGVDTPN